MLKTYQNSLSFILSPLTKIYQALNFFKAKPYLIPITIFATLLYIVILQVGASAVKNYYSFAIDLQDEKCLPYTLYFLKKGGVDPRYSKDKRIKLKKGMYVSFVSDDKMMGLPIFDKRHITKMVAGLPGDVLEVKNDVAYVNGKEWGDLSLLGDLNKPIGYYDRKEVVPYGKVLLLGTLKDSYDGRYYGFIDQNVISSQAFPIF